MRSQVRRCRVRSARVITCCLPTEELPLHIGALLDQRVLALVRSRQVGHHDIGKGARSLGGKAAANLSSSKGRSTLWALGRRRALRWRLCRHVGFHHLLHLELRGGGGLGSKAHCSHRVVVSDLPAAGCKERTKRDHNSLLCLGGGCASPRSATRAAWPASLPARLAACAASRPPRASRRRARRCAAARAAARSTRRRRRGRPSRGRPRTAHSTRRCRVRVRARAS